MAWRYLAIVATAPLARMGGGDIRAFVMVLVLGVSSYRTVRPPAPMRIAC